MQAVGAGDVVMSQRVMSLAPGRGSDVTEEVRRKAPGENGMQMVIFMCCIYMWGIVQGHV